MAFTPWMQDPALAPEAPQRAESIPAISAEDWRKRMERGGAPGAENFGLTMPWQQEHWENQRPWTRTAGKIGLGVGMTAGAAALGLAAPGLAFGLGTRVPWLSGLAGWGAQAAPAAGAMSKLGWLGGLGGLLGYANIPKEGAQAPVAPGQPEGEAPPPTTPPILPEPGDMGGGGTTALEQPQVIEVEGQKFWWNPTGGIYGTGGWQALSTQQQRLTPEQELAEATAGRTQETAESAAQRAHQMEMLNLQIGAEQGAIGQQSINRQAEQEAMAEQQMQQMYAADPYKYWAQQGTPTPEAVARLQQGVEPGAPPTQTPLSTPSAQWWGNLLPSEQQQIGGGVNWMGVDPQDWYSMYQRMIPGMGSRQQQVPQWAR